MCHSVLKAWCSIILLTLGNHATAQTPDSTAPSRTTVLPQSEPTAAASRLVLVEDFTASTLEARELKLGPNLDYAPLANFMIGTDLLATTIGVPTLKFKYRWHQGDRHGLALGVRVAYLSRSTMLWGSAKQHFDTLDARLVRPSISWTNKLSPRLNLHTHWATSMGKIDVDLSETGKRKLWESKHPGQDYDERNSSATTDSEGNPREGSEEQPPEGPATYAQRTTQVQSLSGLMSDLFQVTGEFQRGDDKKVLLSSRIENNKFEDLTSKSFRITAAQQWIWEHFQFRLGIGLQYLVMSGNDLDGEKVDEEAILPATDIDFYWRF